LNGDKELPIRFISKSLHKSQLNWSTIEKEAFAIFYTVTKYDFLLRDVKFTIETDHKNLTYLKTARSAKLRRWQLALQEYDFNCIHIAGTDNVVADAFSRLCEQHQENDAHVGTIHTLRLEGSADSPTEERLPVTTEPSIPPHIREQIEKVHNSVMRHFGIEYTRKTLLNRGVMDQGLRRFVAKFIRDCPVCQLRSAVNRQIMTYCVTTASYTPMEVLNSDTIGPVTYDVAENCYILVVIDCFTRSRLSVWYTHDHMFRQGHTVCEWDHQGAALCPPGSYTRL
jgi:hypothetical protein